MGSGDPNSGPHTHKSNTLPLNPSSQALGIGPNVVMSQGQEISEGELGCPGCGEFSVAGGVQIENEPAMTRRSHALSGYTQIRWW